MADKKFTTKNPGLGIVRWYLDGNTGRTPFRAMVLNDDQLDRGVLRLSVFGRARIPIEYRGVRHKDDPFLHERPSQARENGCWDYLPGELPPIKKGPSGGST